MKKIVIIFGLITIIVLSGCLMPAYIPSPEKHAENLLQEVDTSIFQEKFSSRIDFTKEDKIDAENLSAVTGLAKNQICLNISDELKENGFEAKNNGLITYSGETPIKVKIAGICAAKNNILEKDFFQNYTPLIENSSFNLAESGCSEYCTYEKCCILLLIKADE